MLCSFKGLRHAFSCSTVIVFMSTHTYTTVVAIAVLDVLGEGTDTPVTGPTNVCCTCTWQHTHPTIYVYWTCIMFHFLNTFRSLSTCSLYRITGHSCFSAIKWVLPVVCHLKGHSQFRFGVHLPVEKSTRMHVVNIYIESSNTRNTISELLKTKIQHIRWTQRVDIHWTHLLAVWGIS